ncbi:hypothetical protein BMR05_07410 [Methylococcaceae bacterium HT4]|nr:hypothetical protein BMR05_07410 [Methylococcaceae bacterium HT4]TXL23086.1 hypothetical protein BMR03_04170 [Methylococcaceae bacterium HT2]
MCSRAERENERLCKKSILRFLLKLLSFPPPQIMYKYDGLLIHQEYDEHGPIEIVETDGVRALHFGTHPRQQCIY